MTALRADAPPARRTAPPRARTDGFAPEYDAFEPRFANTDRLVMVMLGLEARGGEPGPVSARIAALLAGADAPDVVEHGLVRPGYGPRATMWFAYWRDTSHHDRWAARADVVALFADPALLSGPLGIWRETCVLSLDHNETSYSRADDLTGLAHLSDALAITPVHGYWGSARDRIVAAADDPLAPGEASMTAQPDALGRRVTIVAPGNACLIRTSQDVTRANDEQLASYRDVVEPALLSGLNYLRGHGFESGCFGVRFLDETDAHGRIVPRSCAVGLFASLGHLEAWTHRHATHERIMEVFIGMVRRFKGEPGLHLWHEITVFRAGDLVGEYINCSIDGGLAGARA